MWRSITLTVRTPKSSPPNPDTWTVIPKGWSKLSLIPTMCSAGHGNFLITLWRNTEILLVKIHISNHCSPFHSPSKTSVTVYDPLYCYFQASIPHMWHIFLPYMIVSQASYIPLPVISHTETADSSKMLVTIYQYTYPRELFSNGSFTRSHNSRHVVTAFANSPWSTKTWRPTLLRAYGGYSDRNNALW